MNHAPWKKIGERSGYKGWREILIRTFLLPHGKKADFDIIHNVSYVTVVPLTTDGKVVTVRQFRPGPETFLENFPEGGMEKGETPEEAAYRELLEETGYHSEEIIFLKAKQGAYSTQTQYFLLALNCKKTDRQNLDENEFIVVKEWPLKELRKRISSPEDRFNNFDAAYLALDYLGKLG